jgi:hypothetical protein
VEPKTRIASATAPTEATTKAEIVKAAAYCKLECNNVDEDNDDIKYHFGLTMMNKPSHAMQPWWRLDPYTQGHLQQKIKNRSTPRPEVNINARQPSCTPHDL